MYEWAENFDLSLATVNDDLTQCNALILKQKIIKKMQLILLFNSPEMFRIPANTGANMTVGINTPIVGLNEFEGDNGTAF